MIKKYYELTKPGLVYGNIITTIAGFLLAAKNQIDLGRLLATLVGIALVMASGCIFNNIADRDIDSVMKRTKNRAIVTGEISKKNAQIYGTILLLVGLNLLFWYTNKLTALVGLIGFIVYVFIYTPAKRRTIHATLLGAIAGATPPVVGYTAVSNKLDLGALLLFVILIAWQMPHFYSIAIFRLDDYKTADVPVMPVKKGVYITKIGIAIYVLIFTLAAILLTITGFTGIVYLIIAGGLGLSWWIFALKGFRRDTDDKSWARKMFFSSLVILLVLSTTIAFDRFLK